jgi:hypothetical protein
MSKLDAIMHEHKNFADHMNLLCSILGYRTKPLQVEGPAVTFGQLEFGNRHVFLRGEDGIQDVGSCIL